MEEETEKPNQEKKNQREAKKRSKMKTEKKELTTTKSKFGKINLLKFFMYEKESVSFDAPNYYNIGVKPAAHKKKTLKLCNICFNIANYTCPSCSDKFCSCACFKKHSEVKCIKYLDV
jgi:hypothetical protein